MKFLAILSILAAMTFAISYSVADPKPQPTTEATQASSAASQEATSQLIVKGSNEFAFDLYAKLAAKEKGNLFFSPCSIHTALAMTYAGAAGDTAKQMAKTLHFTLPADKLSAGYAEVLKALNNPTQVEGPFKRDIPEPAYQLVIANALWGQKGYGFKPAFSQLLLKNYGAGLNEVDFTQSEQARRTINDSVAKQTKDKIKDIIPQGELNDTTRLVLTNALCFKARWDMPFDESVTKNGTFKLSVDKSVDVPMMHKKEMGFLYAENDDVQILLIPCTQYESFVVLVLPKKIDGLANIEKSLTFENLGEWAKDMKEAQVDVTLPKFTFSNEFILTDTLKAMGVKDAFDSGKADFSGMSDKKDLSISAAIHKTFVAVDEEGIEAAAATGVSHILGIEPNPKVFKADHPFVFMVRHSSTGEILFLGRVANPKSE
jgi:serpin B